VSKLKYLYHTQDQFEHLFFLAKFADQRYGSAAAAGPRDSFSIIAPFLANRACERAAEPLSAGAGVRRFSSVVAMSQESDLGVNNVLTGS